jgi:hypothetical protein
LVEQVQESKLGPLKDDEARTVPIQEAPLPVLTACKLKSGGTGLLSRPDRPGRRAGRKSTPSTFMRPHTLHARLRAALKACDLPTDLTWYQCTRHTFASQWGMANGSIEKLAAVLGHSSTEVSAGTRTCAPTTSGRPIGGSSTWTLGTRGPRSSPWPPGDRQASGPQAIGQKLARSPDSAQHTEADFVSNP